MQFIKQLAHELRRAPLTDKLIAIYFATMLYLYFSTLVRGFM